MTTSQAIAPTIAWCVATNPKNVINPSRVPHRARVLLFSEASEERAERSQQGKSIVSVTDLAPVPTRQAIQAKTASKPKRVTGALAVACKSIIEQGLELDKAAKRAGITTRTLRLALERPHVVAWMKRQREVFRAYVCGQNIFHAQRIRNRSGNAMARLGAIKVLEGMDAEQHHRLNNAFSSSPGLVIVVNGGNVTASPVLTEQRPQPQVIDNDE